MEELSSLLGMSIEEIRGHSELLINVLDHEHRILFWNKRCEVHFGVEAEAALGRRFEDVVPFFKRHEKLGHIDRALLGKEVLILNDHYQLSNGRYEQRVIPIKDQYGKVTAALTIVKTITEKSSASS